MLLCACLELSTAASISASINKKALDFQGLFCCLLLGWPFSLPCRLVLHHHLERTMFQIYAQINAFNQFNASLAASSGVRPS